MEKTGTIKLIVYCCLGVACVSFFLISYSTCLADVIAGQDDKNNEYDENISNSSLNDNASLYQPFHDPIVNWQTITDFEFYGCNTGLAEFNSDPYLNVDIELSDSINDCLAPDVTKCEYQLTVDTGTVECDQLPNSAWPDLGHYDVSVGTPIENSNNLCIQPIGVNNNVICGIRFYSVNNPYSYPTTGENILFTSGYVSTYPAGYNFASSTATFPLWFNLNGTMQQVATTTNTCDCNFTSTSTNLFDIAGNAIYCAIKSSICWAFVPDSGTIQNLASSTKQFESKFPFNTFFDLTNSVHAAVSTTTNMTNSLGLPFIRKTGTTTEFYILPVISSSSMPKAIGQNNTNIFRKGIGYVAYAISGGLIFLMVFML